MSRTKGSKNKSVEIKEITRQEVETFSNPIGYDLDNLCNNHKEPSCFNSRVYVRKYKITAELVDEPIEIIQKRIKKLWHECDNYHHHEPLKYTAQKYGLELKYKECGIDRKLK